MLVLRRKKFSENMRTAWFRGCRSFSDRSLKRLMLRGKPVYSNDEIVFDHVRVLDRTGAVVGDMSTSDGIELARSQGLNLNLIQFDVDPPMCVISDDDFISNLSRKLTSQLYKGSEDFSFDPTARPSTIQISVNIADEEYERKIDLLRKHLLDRRRCRLVLNESERGDHSGDRFRQMAERVLGDVRDIAKPADSPEDMNELLSARPLILNIWPCDPEQTQSNTALPQLEESESSNLLNWDEDLDNHERSIRPRIDPRLSPARREIISDD